MSTEPGGHTSCSFCFDWTKFTQLLEFYRYFQISVFERLVESFTLQWNSVKGLPVFRMLRAHSIILASCKPGFRSGLQPGFRQVRAGFATRFRPAFNFFVENLVANRSRFAGSCAC